VRSKKRWIVASHSIFELFGSVRDGSIIRTESSKSFPGEDAGIVIVTPCDFDRIVSSVTQFSRLNVIGNPFWFDDSFARDFVNAFGTRAFGSQKLEGKLASQTVRPDDFQNMFIFDCSEGLRCHLLKIVRKVGRGPEFGRQVM